DRDFNRRGRATVLANNANNYAVFKRGVTLPLGSTTNIESATGANLTLKSNGASLGSPRTFVPPGYAGPTDGGAAMVANAGRFNLDLSNDAVIFNGGRHSLLVAPRSEAVTATIRRQFSPRVQVFAEAAASNVTSISYMGLPLQSNFSIPASAPNNPFQQAIVVRVPSASTDGTTQSLSFSRRLALGSIAKLGADWQVGADYTWSSSRFAYAFSADGLLPTAAAAVASGQIQVLRDTNLYPVDFSPYLIGGQRTNKPFRTAIHDVSLRGSGPVATLPAGPAMLSALLEWRDERFGGDAELFTPRSNSSLFFPARSQMVKSISAQLLTPIISERNRLFGVHELELQLAGRFDEFTTNGVTGIISSVAPVTAERVQATTRSTDPTIALRYRPVADVTVRASFGTGFLPPTVNQLLPNPPGFGSATLFDPRRGGTQPPGPYTTLTGGNPQLRPERSESRSAGIIVTPHVLPGLRLSVDYVRVKKEDNITGFSVQQAVDTEPLLPERVVRGPNLPGDPPGWAGPITLLDRRLLNISQAEVEAYDLQLDYERQTANAGTFTFMAMCTRQTHYKSQVVIGTPIFENVGYASALKFKANFGLTWRRGRLTLGWNARYFDAYRLFAPTTPAATVAPAVVSQGSEKVPSQVFHDLFWSYRFGGTASSTARRILSRTELSGGFRNILNRTPAYDTTTSFTGYYSYFGDPRMASYYLSVKRSF
ncbi:MAG: TonB-dependent receptor, partial [Opitutaceae bacterium]